MRHSDVSPPSLASMPKPALTVIDGDRPAKVGDVEVVPHGRDSYRVRQWVRDAATGKVEPRIITRDDAPDDKSTQHHYHGWGNREQAVSYAERYVAGRTDGQRMRAEVKDHEASGPIYIGNYKGE